MTTQTMDKKTTSALGEFIINNAKTIVMCVAFIVGLYLQHQANTMRIQELEEEMEVISSRQEQQYAKLDNVKLDKAVFEATMRQFSEMSTDIRSIREQLESVMKQGKGE